LYRLGEFFTGFSVFTKPTLTCAESTGCIPEALGSTIRPKRRKNTGAEIPVAVVSLLLRATQLPGRPRVGRFYTASPRVFSSFRHRTFPRLRQLGRAVMRV